MSESKGTTVSAWRVCLVLGTSTAEDCATLYDLMQHNSLVFAAMAMCLVPLVAYGDDASKTAKVEEFLKLAKMDETLRRGLALSTSQVNSGVLQRMIGVKLTSEQEQLLKELQDKVNGVMSDALGWEKLKPAYIKLYAEAYSEAELDDIVAFYKSATGRSMVLKGPLLITNANEIVQQRMAVAEPAIQKLVREFMVQTVEGAQPLKEKRE